MTQWIQTLGLLVHLTINNIMTPKSEDVVYSGISFIKDSQEYYDILQSTDISRNDLILLQQLDSLQSKALVDWFDVGNVESHPTVQQDALQCIG